MRDRWYGDDRDVVKWAVLVALARKHAAGTIVQIAFCRPDPPPGRLDSRTDEAGLEVPAEVLAHFRRLDGIQALARRAKLKIRVHRDPFEGRREDYLAGALRKLRSCRDRPRIAFLDPDTGLSPKNGNRRHVGDAEVRRVFDALEEGDVLVLYQHARRKPGWRKSVRKQLARALDVKPSSVDRIRSKEIAKDVAFFAVPKGA